VGRLPGAEDLVGDLKVSGIAQTATEVAKWSTFLPDIRKVRRATSQYSWFFSPDAKVASAIGDPRTYISALDFVQNQMWRPLTLLTGGYRLRNMIESTFFRTPTIRGIDSGPTHPFEWMMMLTGKKYVGDLDGNELNQVGQQFAGRAGRAWREATGSVPREVMSESGQLEMAYRGGYYALAKKTRDNPDYVRGVANEIRLLAGDDVARRLADELSVDEVLEELKTTEWGRRYVDLLVSRHKQVMLDYTDEAGKTVRKRGDIIYKYTDDAGVEQYTESLDVFVRDMLERVQRSTGNNETLRRIIANTDGELGRFVTFDGKQTQAFRQTVGSGAFPNDEYEMFDYTDEFLAEIGNIWKVENEMLEAGTDLGQNVLPNFVKFVKPIDLQDLGVGTRAQWWRTTMNHFFGQVFGKPEAFLNRSPVFRAAYYRKVNDLIEANLLSREGYEFIVQNVTTSVRKNVDSRLRMLEQLKPDAKGLYRWNDQLISKSKYERVLNGARKDAENANKYVKVVQRTDPVTGRVYDDFVVQPEFDKYAARWVGSEDLWKTISNRLRDPSTPFEGLAGDQVSFAAKAFAMEQTKQAFYNAAETSNFADIMRIAVPFGPAWGEAMRFYVKEIAKDPERIKKAAVSVQGFRDMDPDNDGKGFIFQDPVTQEMVFNYPLDSKMLPFLTAFAGSTLLQTFARGGAPSAIAGAAIGAATGEGLRRYAAEQTGGLDVALQAPAQSLSQSFQVLPGFGPVVQFAATQIMGDRPQFDDVMSVVAPFGAYGSPTAALVPSWAQKITQALTADPDNDRFFGDLYIDTYRAMYASGEYDNTNPESMQLLRQRARRAAGALLTLRGLGQFTGPARPELELRVPTKYEGEVTVNDITQMVKGNITSSMLAATFRQMQEEDYENAVQNFLRTFGADMMLYLPGLSNTEVKGLQATDMFGDWERNNRDLTEKFPLVYGYFAPDGGEFELQTYLRQIREKKRTKITDPQDLQRDAEAVVGRALYMDAVRMAGLNPSPADEARLKALRQEIGDRLPGFAISPINIREQAQIMLQIENATSDPDLDGNPVAEASRVYFRYRQQAIDEAMRRSGGVFTEGLLSRKDNADLRQWLRKTGDVLMTQYPEFQRLYARVLFDEVDL
jgi:hypothetical protein